MRRLNYPAAVGLVDGNAHRIGDSVGVHHHLALNVPGGPADGLDERRARPQVALFVGIKDCHQRHLGEVEALSQQVDPDHNVVNAETEVPKDLDTLQRQDLRVQVVHPHTQFPQVVRKFLGHPFGQRGHEHPLVLRRRRLDALQQVVDLPFAGSQNNFRVDESGRPDDLLGASFLVLCLIPAGSGRNVHDLVNAFFKFFERQWPVVDGGRQPEAEIYKCGLTRNVTLVHCTDLREGDVRLIDKDQEVVREVVQ